MSIRSKLLLGFLSVSILAAVIGTFGILDLVSANQTQTTTFETDTKAILSVLSLTESLKDLQVGTRNELISTDDLNNKRAKDLYEAGLAGMKKALNDLEVVLSYPAIDLGYRNLADVIKSSWTEDSTLVAQVMVLGLQNRNQEAWDLLKSDDGLRITNNLTTAFAKLSSFAVERQLASQKTGKQSADLNILILVSLVVLGVAAALFLGTWITGSIVRPVRRVNDDLGEASRALESASLQVSSSSQELSSSSTELASSIEEMSSTIEEFQSTIEANTNSVEQSELLMQETNVEAQKVTTKIGELKTALGEISEHSKKISTIIKVIDEIAFQTNMLALNAAVEAARAGEAGNGFAVVADEVKALAQKSSQAAKETADLIEKAIGSSEKGDALGAEVNDAQILSVEKASRVAVLLDEVSQASKEQLKGATQIAQAVTQINAIVQTTASSSEENATAGTELLSQAESLAGNVVRLAGVINGKSPSKSGRTLAGARTAHPDLEPSRLPSLGRQFPA